MTFTPHRLGGSAALRTQARRNHTANKPDTAVIMRPTVTPSPDFGETTVYNQVDVSNASFWSISGGEALVLERLEVRASAFVGLEHDTDVTEQDEIVLTEGESGQIHHFKVVLVQDRTNPLTVTVACEEYKQEQA